MAGVQQQESVTECGGEHGGADMLWLPSHVKVIVACMAVVHWGDGTQPMLLTTHLQ